MQLNQGWEIYQPITIGDGSQPSQNPFSAVWQSSEKFLSRAARAVECHHIVYVVYLRQISRSKNSGRLSTLVKSVLYHVISPKFAEKQTRILSRKERGSQHKIVTLFRKMRLEQLLSFGLF